MGLFQRRDADNEVIEGFMNFLKKVRKEAEKMNILIFAKNTIHGYTKSFSMRSCALKKSERLGKHVIVSNLVSYENCGAIFF